VRYSSGTYKLWFGYLQLAIRSGVPINEKYYSNWGTPAELEGMTFNRGGGSEARRCSPSTRMNDSAP